MIEAKNTHRGQYKPYGDSHTIWDILTDQNEQDTFAWAKENLLGGKDYPFYAEWHANIRYNGPRQYDMEYYFRGYISFTNTETGFRLEHVTPCTD